MNISDEDVLDAVQMTRDPVATTPEVAAHLPIGARAVLNRLNDLADEGRVRRKDVGAHSAVWWVAGSLDRTDALERTSLDRRPVGVEGDTSVPDLASADASPDTSREAAGPPPEETSPAPADSVDTDRASSSDVIDDILADWSPGRAGADDVDRRITAGRAAVAYIREEGADVRASDIKRDVFPEFQIGDESPDSWWRRTAREAVNRARDADLVSYTEGEKTYDWVHHSD